MHEAIAGWPSDAFYAGTLIAHPAVGGRRLPEPAGPLVGAVAARETPVVLVDSCSTSAREIMCAARAVQALVCSGVPATQVGVVAPFRRTVAAVRRLLEADPCMAGCTVDTVDRFQ